MPRSRPHLSFAHPRAASRARLLSMCAMLIFGGATLVLAQTEEGSQMSAWLGIELFQLIRSADIIGKLSLLVLAIVSVLSWMVIVYKFLHIRHATRQTNQFVAQCNQTSGQLEEAFKLTGQYPDSPLAQILRESYLELEVENWFRDGYDLTPETRFNMVKVSSERIFERTIASEITHLESRLVMLATTSHVCPFIGLFGTVWGIMHAFQAIAASGGAVALNTLAPGIATALLTTVGGLFCAIPASVMYNYLTHNVRLLTERMDGFALELSNVIQKTVMKQGRPCPPAHL